MRIALFRNDLSIVDVESYNSQEIGLARGFASLGHRVDVLTVAARAREAALWQDPEHPGVRVLYLPYRLLPVLEAPVFLGLRRVLSDGRYDLVQINDEGSVAAWHMALLCRHARVPYVIYQGMFRVLSGRSRSWYERFHKLLLRATIREHVTTVFAKTRRARRFLEARGYSGVTVLPVGLDPHSFGTVVPKDWRVELDLDPSVRLLVYVGALEHRRKPELLVEIAERLAPRFHLVVIGDGPERVVFERAAQRLPGISLVGRLPQSQLPSLYATAHCVLLPSTFEIYGMVVLEALHFGAPVVCSPEAGPADIIEDDRLGELVEGFRVDSWTDAIERCGHTSDDAADRTFRQRRTRTRYDWSVIAGEYLERVGAGSV